MYNVFSYLDRIKFFFMVFIVNLVV